MILSFLIPLPMSDFPGVPILDLSRNHQPIQAELENVFQRVLTSGQFILGPEVTAFEKECADYLGAKHVLGVSSGTDALTLAMMALGIGPGDEVIVPSYTFFATAGCVSRLGAVPVFADSTFCCYNISPAEIEKKITPKTKAIMPVHLFGQSADLAPIQKLAEKHGLFLIEDAAQAIGAKYQGRPVGTFGHFGCFSFFPTKNLGAFGDAGLLTTNDDKLAAEAKLLRTHGDAGTYLHEKIGANFRIDALQAALLRVKLRHLDASAAGRQKNARLYLDKFKKSGQAGFPVKACACQDDSFRLPENPPPILLPFACQSDHVYNQFVVLFTQPGARDRVQKHLQSMKIGARIYYPVPLHAQPCFASLPTHQTDFPFSDYAAGHSLALPIFPELREDEIDQVVKEVIVALS
jgi:dTDP-4-amino-4,6-dideoxygalactose transaminase